MRNSNLEPSGKDITEVRKVTWLGMAVNIALAAIKMVAGLLGNSQAVVADAVHSISDCATDVAILVGVRFWSKPPDEDHPYGHRRIETLVTIFIGVSLAAVAIGLGWNAMRTFGERHAGPPGLIALLAAAVSIGAKEGLYRWTVIVGRRVRSAAVVANAWHHRSDALSSIPAFAAVGGALLSPSLVWLDHIGAIVVSLFILSAAWTILKPALHEIADTGASAKARAEITDISREVAGVLDVHALRTRRAGGGLHADLHVQVDPELTVQAGHEIGHEVKARILEGGPDVLDVLVHIEPHGVEHED